jgi:hypothetical protein
MSLSIILTEFWHTLIEFIYAPFIFKDMLWILIPVALAIGLMELYFIRYPREGLGHHKSLENAIFLVFVSFDLIRQLVLGTFNMTRFYIVVLFAVFSVVISILDYYHKLPISIFHKISSKHLIAFLTYIIVVLLYSDMLENITLIHILNLIGAILCLLLIIVLVTKMMAALEPKSYEEIEHFLKNIEDDIKKTSDSLGEKEDDEDLKDKKKNNKKAQPK